MPKKKNKNKMTPPVEGVKKEEEEKTEDHGEGGSSSDTVSGHKNRSAEVKKPVAAPGESSGGRNFEHAKSAASREEPPQVREFLAMFKQVEIPGKGQGLVANAKLRAGTILVQEAPLITAESDPDLFNHDIREIVAKFRRLTDEQKNQVLSLYDFGPTSPQGHMLALWSVSNWFSFADETEEKAVRIFGANCIA